MRHSYLMAYSCFCFPFYSLTTNMMNIDCLLCFLCFHNFTPHHLYTPASASQHCSKCDASFCNKCKSETHVGEYMKRHEFVPISKRPLKCEEDEVDELDQVYGAYAYISSFRERMNLHNKL
jgi:hypothetical protein